jgi:hypothetical protein
MSLEHLRTMTDDTGLLQHAAFNVPRYDDGYCVDDNARALLLLTLMEDAGAEMTAELRALASRYMAFVKYAFNEEIGRFRNFMSYGRVWTETCGSEDSHGRALWALGTLVGRSNDPGRQSLAGELFGAALPAVHSFASPRAWAYALLGIDEHLRAFQGDSGVEAAQKALASKLLARHGASSHADWPWFEDRLTYCNARLPQALMLAGARMGDAEMIATGVKSLEWLAAAQQTSEGYFAPVGTNGFHVRGEVRATFDQQPVEACAMISACLDAQRITGDPRWIDRARSAFAWFLGQNELHASLYEPRTGACRDGLHADRANQNQGAESTLSFLLALLDMRAADRATLAKSRTHTNGTEMMTS